MAESKEYTAIIAVPTYADLETADRTKLVFVNDATADPTVDRGGAMYNYSQTEHRWVKRYEEESMDLKTTKVINIKTLQKFDEKQQQLYWMSREIMTKEAALELYRNLNDSYGGTMMTTLVEKRLKELLPSLSLFYVKKSINQITSGGVTPDIDDAKLAAMIEQSVKDYMESHPIDPGMSDDEIKAYVTAYVSDAITELQNEIMDEFHETVNTINARLVSMESQLSGIRAEIDNHRERLTAVEGDVDTLKEQIDSVFWHEL